MMLGGSDSTTITFQEVGRRGGEEHTSMGGGLATGVKAEDLLPKRHETFSMDHNWVQQVRGSLLELEAGVMPSKKDIKTSERFVP